MCAQCGDTATLLAQLAGIVEAELSRLGLRVDAPRRPEPPAPPQFQQEKPAMPEWFVSYAWGDDKTTEGQKREQRVNEACEAALAAGKSIQRDKNVLRPGESIERFMKRITAGDRVFVFLSDQYLKSPFCMYELSGVCRKCGHDADEFRQRVHLWTLDDAKIWEPDDRAQYGRHWREKYEKLKPCVADLGNRDLLARERMRTFHADVGEILATVADTVQPRQFSDFLQWGCDEPPP